MADFNIAVVKTLSYEGGETITYTTYDKGGVTKFGISQNAYPNIDISNLTEEDAKEIYHKDYWLRCKCNHIESQVVAENIFDTAVNMGVRASARLVQQAAMALPIDGVIGPITLGKINEMKDWHFLNIFALFKIKRYADIVNSDRNQGRFLLGWLNRTLSGISL